MGMPFVAIAKVKATGGIFLFFPGNFGGGGILALRAPLSFLPLLFPDSSWPLSNPYLR
jgi:hypothetical protein